MHCGVMSIYWGKESKVCDNMPVQWKEIEIYFPQRRVGPVSSLPTHFCQQRFRNTAWSGVQSQRDSPQENQTQEHHSCATT